MKQTDKIVKSLSPSEKKVLPHITTRIDIQTLAKKAGTEPVEAMRACQFLNNKQLINIQKAEQEHYTLTNKGKEVTKKGLPEQRFIQTLNKPKTLQEIQEQAKLDKDELNISIGILKKAGAIILKKKVERKTTPDFSKKIAVLKKIDSNTQQELLQELLQRGLLEKNKKTTYTITLTPLGKKIQGADLSKEYTERLTPKMLEEGSWKQQEFRHYDVTSPVPATAYGREHFVTEAIDYIKNLWLEMGFTEMTGTMTQTAFEDLDILFVPQDHPARDEQDTFYLPGKGTLPKWWEDIKTVHENGGDTGSKGWGYKYSEEEASRILLRTHTTVLSAQTLKKLDPKKDLPGKYFSVNKVFRNETLDWKHLAEFYQVEGIVVDENLTLADLIGLQKEFYKKMGFTNIRFRPAYFPYTEPSAEVEVYHPTKKEWVELGGMGVFRPEVVKPLLGIDVPVLAWGLGMERIITDYYDIKDLRHIYDNDLERLRTTKRFIRRKE